MSEPIPETVVRITHLRDSLGWAYRHVVETDAPNVVRRCKTQDVMLVPAWEWRFLKRIEAAIREGKCPWEGESDESAEDQGESKSATDHLQT